MIIKRVTYNNRVKSIKLDENTIESLADHLVGKRLSVYRERVYDADGDKKVTLKDFVHRIKNVAGVETQDRISVTTAEASQPTGGTY